MVKNLISCQLFECVCVCVREDTHGELEGGWERKEDAAPGVSLCLFLHLTVTLCFVLFFWLFLFVCFVLVI